jgi:hypothetical protein
MANTGDPASIAHLRNALIAEGEHPIVREHAAWALGRFDDSAARLALDAAWRQLGSKSVRRINNPNPNDTDSEEALRQEISLAIDRVP